MRITFDPVKNARDIGERGLSLERVADLAWDAATSREDTRKDYGERRVRVAATLEGRLHIAIVTYREGAVHVISFRKANAKEIRRYEAERR